MRIRTGLKTGLRMAIVLKVFLAMLLQPFLLWAYTDGVSASPEQVKAAVEKLLEPHGFREIDREKGVFESEWIEDEVFRKKDRFILGETRKKYLRRYRVRYELHEKPRYVDVRIKTVVEFKREDAGPMARWSPLKMSREDKELERQSFHDLLETLAGLKRTG